MVKLPKKKGQRIQITAHGRTLVIRKTVGAYFLRVEGQQRARWADYASEAREDIDYFLETGALPRDGGNWP